MPRDKCVNIWQRSSHSANERLIGVNSFTWIDSNSVMGRSQQTRHVDTQNLRVLDLPIVKNNHDDIAAENPR